MMTYEVGSRVFAVRDADSETVMLFGFGTYVGDEIPDGQRKPDELTEDLIRESIIQADENPLGMLTSVLQSQLVNGQITQEQYDKDLIDAAARLHEDQLRPMDERVQEVYDRVALNPCIKLDSGGVVWGYQCWWGPEKRFDEWVAGRMVELVELPEVSVPK